MKKLLILGVFVLDLCALEFGQMGNMSAGMGGAGVALKNSQWAIYYNPALLAVNKKSGFAYSFGANVRTNLIQAAQFDVNNVEKLADKFNQLLDSTSSTSGISALNTSLNLGSLGILGDVIAEMIGQSTNSATDDDLMNYISNIAYKYDVTTSGSSVNDIINSLGDVKEEVFSEIKGDLLDAISSVAKENSNYSDALGLLGALLENVTLDNIETILKSVDNGNFDAESFVSNLLSSGVTIGSGSDSELNKLLSDVRNVFDVLNNNDVSVSSQNGLVFNFGFKEAKRGTISIALMPSVFLGAGAKFDDTYLSSSHLIYDGYRIDFGSGNSITVSEDNTGGSIMDSNIDISAKSLILTEIPIGYGHLFWTRIGNIAVGGALKYIAGFGYNIEKSTTINNLDTNIDIPTTSEILSNVTSTFGLDLGVLYVPVFDKNLNIGLVAKNINAPRIDVYGSSPLTLNTQVRAGVSYGFLDDKIVLAADVDVLPNDTLSINRPKSQMIGGGVLFDAKFVDLRLGAMYDFRHQVTNESLILTAGINILGFLDLAVQSNLNLTDVSDYIGMPIKLPSYLYLKVGGGFSW